MRVYLKKVIGVAIGALMISSSAFAMTFSQHVELGKIGGTPEGGFWIHGADYNNGTSYQNGKYDEGNYRLYEKGIARFGKDDKGLWIYYDCSSYKNKKYWDAYSPNFGDKNQEVKVALGAGEGESVNINYLPNDENIAMYFLAHYGCVVGLERYVVMGYDKKGKFVKYIDTRDIVKNYLGEKNFGTKDIFLKKYYFRGDSIIIEYMDPRTAKGFKIPAGAFHFKWDNKAQWFGVEHVVY